MLFFIFYRIVLFPFLLITSTLILTSNILDVTGSLRWAGNTCGKKIVTKYFVERMCRMDMKF